MLAPRASHRPARHCQKGTRPHTTPAPHAIEALVSELDALVIAWRTSARIYRNFGHRGSAATQAEYCAWLLEEAIARARLRAAA
jgi:hypothetical protein